MRNLKMKKLILASLICVTTMSNALSIPKANHYDAHIRTVEYNPNNVVLIKAHKGVTTMISLSEDETIPPKNSVSLGDIKAWGIASNGNHLFLKPIAANPNTNLIIISSTGRVYNFYLEESRHPYYVVKENYDKINHSVNFKYAHKHFDAPCSKGKINFKWKKWGDNSLAPSIMWNDNDHICMRFTKQSSLPIPYIYENGVEKIVNYNMSGNIMVLHTVNKEIRLREDKKVIGLMSNYAHARTFNDTGTASKYLARVEKSKYQR